MLHIGRSSQKKGRGGELEICRIFQAHGISAEPGEAVSFGSTPDVVGIPSVHAEVKRVERLNVPEAMAQAVRDSERFNDGMPVLFHRRNRQGWLCTMCLEDWLQLYQHHKCQCGGHCNRQKTAKTGGEGDIDP